MTFMIHYIDENKISEEIVINSTRVMLLDVSAEWCIPCQMLSPILNELDKKYKDVQIFKINADECSDFLITNNISSIPTLILYKDGEEKERVIGLESQEKLSGIIDDYIDKE